MSRSSETLHARLTPEGYLDTEDRVAVSDDRVHFLGRAAGIINVGGNKVHPEESKTWYARYPGSRMHAQWQGQPDYGPTGGAGSSGRRIVGGGIQRICTPNSRPLPPEPAQAQGTRL